VIEEKIEDMPRVNVTEPMVERKPSKSVSVKEKSENNEDEEYAMNEFE
jgi:hypothetical protein